jgi:hypothetical protein
MLFHCSLHLLPANLLASSGLNELFAQESFSLQLLLLASNQGVTIVAACLELVDLTQLLLQRAYPALVLLRHDGFSGGTAQTGGHTQHGLKLLLLRRRIHA